MYDRSLHGILGWILCDPRVGLLVGCLIGGELGRLDLAIEVSVSFTILSWCGELSGL